MKWNVRHIDETDSTNRWLREHQEVDAVVADFQTAGRGCGTNSWESERGKNLTFSLRLHPADLPANCQFVVSMANALALKRALDGYVDGISIKWPNDIYWRDRKICGTLIETTLKGNRVGECIIGTGINVNQQVFLSDAPNPVSLAQMMGHEVSCEEVLQRVLRETERYVTMVDGRQWEEVRSSYRRQLYRLGETRLYRLADGRVEECKLVNVTDDGHLELLRDGKETYRFAFKEVQFIL